MTATENEAVDKPPRRRRRRRRKKKLPPDVSVHLATMDDVPEIVSMISAANHETFEPPLDTVDNEFLGHVIAQAVENTTAVVARRSMGRLISVCVFALSPLYYNPKYCVATSFVWWTDPEDRKLGVGVAVLGRARSQAKAVGANGFAVTVRDGDNGTMNSLKSAGFRPVESVVLKEF